MPHRRLRSITRLGAIIAIALLAACQTAPHRPSVAPELKLLGADELRLPRDCVASGSFVISFTVATTGRTGAIRPSEGPSCVQDALSEWVASFRYEPPAQATSASLEWLMVTARRGT